MLRSLPIALLAGAVVFAPPAHAKKRTQIHPYLEIDQTVLLPIEPGGPAQTYTTLAAGVDASTSGPRSEAQISARYEYRRDWSSNGADAHVISGLARARYDVVPNLISIEGGALGTRTRTDIRGGALLPGLGNPVNTSQLYSAYVGPTLATNVGMFDVGAFYRFGYTKVEIETVNVLPVGSRALGGFDSSTSHAAGASIGMRSGVLPFGWTLSGGWNRDDASILDQRYEGKFARADVVVPLTPTVAAIGGVGYEDITASQRDPLLDGAGNPVLTSDGRFITDPASPRRLAYDVSGFIWDVGVLWKPSRRTQLTAKVGRRYGSMTYTGDFSWQINQRQALAIGVYDGITTFGQQITAGLRDIPTQFAVSRDPFSNQFGGCVFGSGDGGAGACLTPALQSIAQGTYRSRGGGAVWRYQRAGTSIGIALGYTQRRFFAPPVGGFSIDGTTDESFYAQANLARRLDEVSGIEASAYANWYDSGLNGAPRVMGVGGTASYYRNFGPRLIGTASVGLYSSDVDGFGSNVVGAGQVGARYTF
ncbi:MAG: hypothetical protein ABI898_10685 [Sphingomonadales bacterium]